MHSIYKDFIYSVTYFDELGDMYGGDLSVGDFCVGWSTVSTLVWKQFPIKKQIMPKISAPTKNPIRVQTSENFDSQSAHLPIGAFNVQFPLKNKII